MRQIFSQIIKLWKRKLEANNADLSTWEAVQFIVENKQWGNHVVLSTDSENNEVYGKYIKILGESLCKVENFTRSSGVIA